MPETPGYAEIAAHYRRQIESGELRPGDTLPSLRQVCDKFGVAHTTANRAFKRLKMEGLTLPRPGVGTVVAGVSSSNIGARVAMHEATGRALGGGETSHILEVGTIGADDLVAPRLDVTPGTPVHVRRRLVSRNGAPVHLSSSYYPAYVIAVTPELSEPVSTGGSRELAAERLGTAQDQVLEEVTSRLATEAEKTALGLTAGDVVVTQVVRTVTLTDGRVVEVAVKVAGGSTILRWSTSLNGTGN
ncbi:mannosyl-D-glycerate transport/metabolism system repressor MngR [Streptomyces diastaticus subsp. diastaticus]|uniref:Mannosyl-D-glycerate transport/metabolism system repressor MngR n=1 Tax=Streptomyces diastaticus subsp. diastaticus TaxID=68040 RepID=A0ABQ1CML6_STRDI|nr:GntR family transcriptional regulator [Streptomyces diastaticus]WTD02109.1 GntR family transcriptional regulator [Streptomyces albidoflavus]GFH71629.1 mannosyl-D-glycerate transport/metabolism system repressor MngR [Streptomyces diastaticus subsp. diastaticus]GGU13638.1 mannosyl-D-glycerate transport/metabolism system repressor MngR [Streptomyces diastaticus subsp. diastaticus]